MPAAQTPSPGAASRRRAARSAAQPWAGRQPAPSPTARGRCGSALRGLLAAALFALGLHPPAAALEDVPYVQTPQPVVDAILELAGVGPGDRLVDLGAGDGRIVITAARRFGTQGLGVEIDPNLVELARQRAAAEGVADRARFVTQDLFHTDLSGASVVTLYLLPDVNLALRPRLLEVLAPGARIVSHDWDMGDWAPNRSVTVPAPNKPVGRLQQSTLHLWVVPAKVGGDWVLRFAGEESGLALALEQRFQQLRVSAGADSAGGTGTGTGTGRVDGRAVAFTLPVAGRTLAFEGVADGGRMSGTVAGDPARRSWEATRKAGPAAR